MKKTNLVIVAIAAMVIAVVTAFQANKNRERDKEEIEVGIPPETESYFYIDHHGVIHTSLDCLVLTPFSNEKAGDIPYYAIDFIKGEELKTKHFYFYCSQCVNDVWYEKIKKMASNSDGLNWGADEEVDWEQYRVKESRDEYE